MFAGLLLSVVLSATPTTSPEVFVKANDEARMKAAREAKAAGSWTQPTAAAPTTVAEILPAWAKLHAVEQDAQISWLDGRVESLRGEVSRLEKEAANDEKWHATAAMIATVAGTAAFVALALSIFTALRRKPA